MICKIMNYVLLGVLLYNFGSAKYTKFVNKCRDEGRKQERLAFKKSTKNVNDLYKFNRKQEAFAEYNMDLKTLAFNRVKRIINGN